VAGTVTYSGLIATFTPTAALDNGTTYAATITTGAQTRAAQGWSVIMCGHLPRLPQFPRWFQSWGRSLPLHSFKMLL